VKVLRAFMGLFVKKCKEYALEERLALDYDSIAQWDLNGDALVSHEENLLLQQFEKSGRE